MNAAVSKMFAPLIIRLGLIFGSLAAMTGAAIFVGWMVMQSIAFNLHEMVEQSLPELTNSAAAVSIAGRVRASMTQLATETEASEISAHEVASLAVLAQLRELASEFPEAEATAINQDIDTVASAFGELGAARAQQFDSVAQMETVIAKVDALAQEVTMRLQEQSDSAFFDLALGSENTIETIDETLTNLVEQDFSAYQAALSVRSEINLLAGLAISRSQTRSLSLISILVDLAQASNARLDAQIDTLASFEEFADSLPPINEARQVLLAGFILDGVRAEPTLVMSARQEIDAILSDLLDTIYFDLVINSEDARAENAAAVRKLLDEQASNLRAAAHLENLTVVYLNTTMGTALANGPIELDVRQGELSLAHSKLAEAAGDAPEDLQALLQQILDIGASANGVAQSRSSVFASAARAGEATEVATLAVEKITRQIEDFATGAKTAIDANAAAFTLEVDQARQKFMAIGVASLLLLALTPVFIWLMVTRPLNQVTKTTERLAEGDLTEVAGNANGHGEIGRLTRALHVFRDGALERIALQEEERRREKEALRAQQEQADAQRAAEARAEADKRQREEQERARDRAEQERVEALRATADAERKAREEEQQAVVSALAEGLQRLSAGDLSHSIDDAFPASYEALRADYNAAILHLADLIRRIGQCSSNIDDSGAEIASSSMDLSHRTENAAATLEQTAVALNQLTESVSCAAAGASDASQTAVTVKNDAENSREVMHKAVSAMSKIEESSSQIAKIVEVIESIAFQTNLLALNAGVEAARAGDSGRGFAVVASEVRILAHRCSEAATQISQLIASSAGDVGMGVRLMDETNSALEKMLGGISQVADTISDIAHSAREQSNGIREINTAVEALDQSTQQNAAMFEETTATSQALSSEASVLAQLISGFSIRDEGPQNTDREGEEAA